MKKTNKVDYALPDKNWEARCNAQTIAQAESIKADPKLYREAKKAAREMLKQEKEKLDGLKRVASGKISNGK